MKLFSKEKDLILKLVNLVLFLWLITCVVLLYASIVDVIMPEEKMTYDEFEASNCNYTIEKSSDDTGDIASDDTYCKSSYQSYLQGIKDNDYNVKRNLFNYCGCIVIISGVLYLLNKKKRDSK